MSWQAMMRLALCLMGMAGQAVVADHVVVGAGVEFQQAIPAEGDGEAWMTPVYLEAPHCGIITDLDVYVDITHPEVSDLLIYLDAPWGATVCLKDDALYQTLWPDVQRSNMRGTFFDDSAVLAMTEGEPPYTGHFLPGRDEALATLNGYEAAGTWTLRIYDMVYEDAGTLNQWELHMDYEPAPEPLGALLLLAGGFTLLRRRHAR